MLLHYFSNIITIHSNVPCNGSKTMVKHFFITNSDICIMLSVFSFQLPVSNLSIRFCSDFQRAWTCTKYIYIFLQFYILKRAPYQCTVHKSCSSGAMMQQSLKVWRSKRQIKDLEKTLEPHQETASGHTVKGCETHQVRN